MKSSHLKKKKNEAFSLDKVEKLLKGTRIKVRFLKGQYYLGTVISSLVRMKPYYKVRFDDGDEKVFPYPVTRGVKIISEIDLSKKSPINYTSIIESNDSFKFNENQYCQAKIRIGKKYQATIPEYLGPYTS